MNITFDNIIADISADLRNYDEAGLIDKNTLKLHLINEVKRFGGMSMEMYPKILQVVNSQATLPENFHSLYKAVRVEPSHCETNEPELEEINFMGTFFRVRKEASREWNNQTEAWVDGDYKEIYEKVYLQNNTEATLFYNNPRILKLVRGFDRSVVDPKCENIHVKSAPHEINIIRNTIQTSFKDGFIFIFYRGLPVDEDNNLIIPFDPNARIYEFLMYSGKAKVFEMLWLNDDDPNTQAKLQFNTQKAEIARADASTQIRFNSINQKDWWHGLKGRMTRRTRVLNNFAINR